MVNYVNKFKE